MKELLANNGVDVQTPSQRTSLDNYEEPNL